MKISVWERGRKAGAVAANILMELFDDGGNEGVFLFIFMRAGALFIFTRFNACLPLWQIFR